MKTAIAEAVYDHLKADAGISAITTSIYPLFLPQEVEVPAIVYQFISEEIDSHLDGQAGNYRKAIVQIDCYATTYEQALDLAHAVESALVDYRGTMGTTSPSIDVDHVRLEIRGQDLYEDDTSRFRVTQDFLIGYQ